MNVPGAFENHALTIVATMLSFADVARVLTDRGVSSGDAGLVALQSVLRSPIEAHECAGRCRDGHDASCLLPPLLTMETIQFAPDGDPLAVSRGHVFDRLSEAKRGGAATLADALGRLIALRDGERFADAVARGQVLIWMMTTSFETASAIASILLAHSAVRVCTFTKQRPAGDGEA